MMFLSVILTVFCQCSIFAASSSSSSSASHPLSSGIEQIRLDESDLYDPIRLSQVYYGSLQKFTRADAERFERLLVTLDESHADEEDEDDRKSYAILLREMIEENQLEDFKALFPLIRFDEQVPFDVDLELRDVGELVPFVDFMLDHGFDAERFLGIIGNSMEDYAEPDDIIDIVEWLAARHGSLAEPKLAFYRDLIGDTLRNGSLSDKAAVEVVKRLVGLGAVVDGDVLAVMNGRMGDSGYPAAGVDVIEWLSGWDADIASRAPGIYREWIVLLLGNTSVQAEQRVELITRLVHLGAAVDEAVLEECTRLLPGNEELHQLLDSNIVPDYKMPEC